MIKYKSICILLFGFLFLFSCKNEPVNYLYENKSDKQERMEWWEEARFGMFIHWGLYAIPAGEWNGETKHAEWIRTTAQIPLDTYNNFVDAFNPVNYDPEQWVQAAKNAGMKYIVITSKHHDGFCLFNSKETKYDVLSSPYEKDILKQLADACHKEGIKICWYYSIMDWHNPDYLPRRSWEKDRTADGADFENYVSYMKAQLKELVDNYGDIGVLWFDGEWEETWTNAHGQELYNYVRNLQPDIIINNRVDVGRSGMAGMTRPGDYAGDFGTPEQEIPSTGLRGVYWETCMTMNDHWGYNKSDSNWKSPEDLIQKLADISSKGGNFLLNVGPRADGSFPDESLEILKSFGTWMEVNSDAIYGTLASPFRKLDFGRCTFKVRKENSRLFFHVFEWPENRTLKIPGIYNTPEKAFLLADQSRNKLEVFRNEDALFIRLPENQPDTINTVVVLDVMGPPDISNPPNINNGDGIFVDLLSVNITADNPDVEIRYTLDGNIPNESSPLAEGALTLRNTTTIVARCFREGKPVSDIASSTVIRVKPLPPVRTSDITPGLVCEYYEGHWNTLPDFGSIKPMKQITVDEFSLESRESDDHYGFLFEGYIELPEHGVYKFFTDSDDGSQLFVDDSLVVDNNGLHGMDIKKGTIPLSKGLHKIKVTYFEKDGGDNLKIYYEGPGFERKPIPSEALFHEAKKENK